MVWPVLLTLVAMAPEASATRVAVAPLRGKGGAACAQRLGEAFSERVRIVQLDAGVEGLTNWDELSEWIEKNGASGADVVVVGSLNKRSIVLEAYATHDKRLVGLKSVVTSGRCKLSAGARKLLLSWIDSVLPDTPAAPPPGPATTEPPPPPPPEEKVGDEKAEVQPKLEPNLEPETAEPTFTVAIRGAVAIGRRDLTFTGATTPNLRAYEVDVMPVPTLALEAYPLAGTGVWEYLRPLGLAAWFSRSIGLSSARIEGGPELDTTHTEVGASLLYRWRVPLPALRFDLIPQVGYHYLGFSLRSSSGGTEPDLPDVGYSSVAFGVGAEVPVLDRVNVFGSGTYLAVLSGGQIFGGGFFDEGTARGYRIEIGMGYRVVEGVVIEIAGHHLAYSLSLNPQPTNERIAETGADTLSGIGLGLRIEL